MIEKCLFVPSKIDLTKTTLKSAISNIALNNLRKLKSRLNIEYDLLLAQYGSSSKINAAKKLISLDTVISYPTLIIVDKDKRVRRIHTGFNGPATGNKFEYFKKDFEEYLYSLRR